MKLATNPKPGTSVVCRYLDKSAGMQTIDKIIYLLGV